MYSKAHLESVCPVFPHCGDILPSVQKISIYFILLFIIFEGLTLITVLNFEILFLRRSSLDPGLPAMEQSAEVFGVHGLLDEQVDLPPDAKYCALLQPFQFLLQPQQHPLCHLVETLTVTAGKRAQEEKEEL